MESDIGHWMSSETLGYRPKVAAVRAKMAAFLNCSADDLVLVDNASNAINILLARLGLAKDPLNGTAPLDGSGGVLLALSVAYGPFVGFYDWLAASRGVEIVYANLSFPATDDAIVAAVPSGA